MSDVMLDKKGKHFANNHTVLVCMFVICAVSCVILLCFGGFKTFWLDDIAQIDIVYRDTLLEVIQNCKSLDCNPPLSHILSHFWLKCVPYGTVYLKSFNIIMVSVGTFICGCVAYRLNGSIAGIAVTICGAVSSCLTRNAAYTFRPYGCLFLFSSILFYIFIKRWLEQKDYIFLFTICISSLLYTHYFGIMVVGTLFFADFLYSLKYKTFRRLIPYLVGIIVFLPWLFYIIKESIQRLANFWPESPGLADVVELYIQLASGHIWLLCGVVAGIVIAVIRYITTKKERDMLLLVCAGIIIIIPAFVFVISNYIKGISSLWVLRYFISIMPFVLSLFGNCVGTVFEMLYSFERKKSIQLHRIALLLSIIAVAYVGGEYLIWLKHNANIADEPFEACAEYLIEQEDIYAKETKIYCTAYNIDNGWKYYLTKKGDLSQEPSRAWYSISSMNLDGVSNVYVVELHNSFMEEDQVYLEENGFSLVENVENLPIKIYRKSNIQ